MLHVELAVRLPTSVGVEGPLEERKKACFALEEMRTILYHIVRGSDEMKIGRATTWTRNEIYHNSKRLEDCCTDREDLANVTRL